MLHDLGIHLLCFSFYLLFGMQDVLQLSHIELLSLLNVSIFVIDDLLNKVAEACCPSPITVSSC